MVRQIQCSALFASGIPSWLEGCRARKPLSLTRSKSTWVTGDGLLVQPISCRKAARFQRPRRMYVSLTRFTACACMEHQHVSTALCLNTLLQAVLHFAGGWLVLYTL